MLEVRDVHSYYGSSHILKGVTLRISPGETVALVGRNGAGKTTTLKSIMGIIRPAKGSIRFKDVEICGLEPFKIARLGIGYVPEDRRIYPALTLKENLLVAQIKRFSGARKWNLGKIYELFPPLRMLGEDRIGSSMSGGEQQMLAIARTLMGNPEFLLLDEPSEGLAPLIVSLLAESINKLRDEGLSVLLSEQNMRFVMKTTSRCYVIDRGTIPFEGATEKLLGDEGLIRKYVTV
jgi:branched-chain amino acid transport system ATP-binding protein